MDKKLIAKVMGELGSRTSEKKAAAARANGARGGRKPLSERTEAERENAVKKALEMVAGKKKSPASKGSQ